MVQYKIAKQPIEIEHVRKYRVCLVHLKIPLNDWWAFLMGKLQSHVE